MSLVAMFVFRPSVLRFAHGVPHAVTKRTSSTAAEASPRIRFKYPWLTLGAATIAGAQVYQYLKVKAAFEKNVDGKPQMDIVLAPARLATCRVLFSRTMSRLWGSVNDVELPVFARAPLYKLWTWVFDCKLDEMKYPLESYRNLSEFFARPLKDGVRPLQGRRNDSVVSPVDGTVAMVGESDGDKIEQVKGLTYSLSRFLGGQHAVEDPGLDAVLPSVKHLSEGKKLYHCVLYLAPGDYHNIHSPVDWKVNRYRHFAGECFPVASWAVRWIQDLFTINERIAVFGQWAHGFFSATAVAAYNVGGIVLKHEQLQTNRADQTPEYLSKVFTDRPFDKELSLKKGDEFAGFRLGSTVVLIFESPEFLWAVKAGQKIKMGELLGGPVKPL